MSCYGSDIQSAIGACWFRGRTGNARMLFCIMESGSPPGSSHRVYNIDPGVYPRLSPEMQRINRTDINATIHVKSLVTRDAGDYSCVFQGVSLRGSVKLSVFSTTPRPLEKTSFGPTADQRRDDQELSKDHGEGAASLFCPAVVGVIVALVFLLALGLAVCCWLRRRRTVERPDVRRFRVVRVSHP